MRTVVYGPAYLDRVARVDRPLVEGATCDGSLTGRVEGTPGEARLHDRLGREIVLGGLAARSALTGPIGLDGELPGPPGMWNRVVRVTSYEEDLGGMGAGFAAALGGGLVSAIAERDAIGSEVVRRLEVLGIAHRPIRVPVAASDWSLIVSSGPFGDKLAIGFRGCHAAVRDLPVEGEPPCDVLVVASLPNRLIEQALRREAAVRFVAPAMRNALDRDPPLSTLAGRFDVLSLNRREWFAIPDRDALAAATPIVIVTDGPEGCRICYRDGRDEPRQDEFPAFPRDEPPRDTNRAGEAFAATFLRVLMASGWRPGPVDGNVVREAALRASAASALVLDREDFGFPSDGEVDAALHRGRVAGEDRGPGSRSPGEESA